MHVKRIGMIAAALLAVGGPALGAADDLTPASGTTTVPAVVMMAPSHFAPAEPAHIPEGTVPPGTVVFSQTLKLRTTGILAQDVYWIKRLGGDRLLAAKGTPVYKVRGLRDDLLQDFWCTVPAPVREPSSTCFPEIKGQVYGVPAGNSFFRGRLSVVSRTQVSELQVSETATNEKRYVMEVRALAPRGKGTMSLELRMSELGSPEPDPVSWTDDRPGVAYLISGNGEDVAAVVYDHTARTYKVERCPRTICQVRLP